MKLWIAERTDGTDYDEYDTIVIRAENFEAARQILMTGDHDGGTYTGFTEYNYTLTPLTHAGEPGAVVESYCAG